jgi:epoxyqueuosine reductase
VLTFEAIKEKAFQLGWDDVGIAPAIIPEDDIRAYKKWIAENSHAGLHYMENDLRCYPEKLFPGAKTAIIFVTYYKQEKLPFKDNAGMVASYARGRDYHHVHRKRLKKFIAWMEDTTGLKDIAKGFSDSTPVMEKALAVQAGLGWFGKNTLLIHRKFGTFTLLSGIFTSLDISGTQTYLRLPRCGSCTKCLDACPTQAIQPYHLDAVKCLSYQLIESKNPIPDEIRKKNPGYAFGCDICQDACPHNVRKKETHQQDFSPNKGIGGYIDQQLLLELEATPEKLYGTPLQRRGVEGLKHTLSPENRDKALIANNLEQKCE